MVHAAERFPPDFMFQLTKEEFESLRFQIATSNTTQPLRFQNETSNTPQSLRSQNVTSNSSRGGTRYMPYAFTEQGVAMLSGLVNSDVAIAMNIAIMRAFVEVRRIIYKQIDLGEQVREIKDRLGEHDVQLTHIYDAMENLLDAKAAEKKWDDRERIGFKNN